jgi:hypothetical protein
MSELQSSTESHEPLTASDLLAHIAALTAERDQAIAHGAALQAELTAARGACHRAQAALREVATVTRQAEAALRRWQDLMENSIGFDCGNHDTDIGFLKWEHSGFLPVAADALAALAACPHLRAPQQIADEPWSPQRWDEETGRRVHTGEF